jgi:hypothetical protein
MAAPQFFQVAKQAISEGNMADAADWKSGDAAAGVLPIFHFRDLQGITFRAA